MRHPLPSPVRLLLVAILSITALGCGSSSSASGAAGGGGVTVRLGYFPTVTQAPAIVGDLGGFFTDQLGDGVTLKSSTFNAGPEAVEALFAAALDVAFIGPNPAINAYARSDGAAIRIVSGTTSGGAFLVVRDGIDNAADLRGATLASPQLGNTQDVALRAWLQDQGYRSDEAGGGDVSIQPQSSGDALAAFVAGDLDGAWVPEPYATRFVQEGGAHVLVDERDLWPDGKYVTAQLVVRTAFLDEHPDVVKAIISGLADAIDLIDADPARAKSLTNEGIAAVTDKALTQPVIDAAWDNLTFTLDPFASTLEQSAHAAESVGLLDPVDLTGIYDLTLLNEVLAARSQPPVRGLS